MRPLYFEQYAIKAGSLGYAHRDRSEIIVSLKVDNIAKNTEDSLQRVGIYRNGAVALTYPVKIEDILRISTTRDGELTIYKSQDQEWLGPIEWFNCKSCGMSLPNGTNICWDVLCQRPATKVGFDDWIRVYSTQGNIARMKELFELIGPDLGVVKTKAQIRREYFGHWPAAQVPRGILDSKSASEHISFAAKLMKMAARATKMDHTGIIDPENIDQYLVEPGSRKFHNHMERYTHDIVYQRQCIDANEVGKDGRLWFKGTDNVTGEKGVYVDADESYRIKQMSPKDPRGSSSFDRGDKTQWNGRGKMPLPQLPNEGRYQEWSDEQYHHMSASSSTATSSNARPRPTSNGVNERWNASLWEQSWWASSNR